VQFGSRATPDLAPAGQPRDVALRADTTRVALGALNLIDAAVTRMLVVLTQSLRRL